MSEIAIIGAGAWGTALSIVLARTGSHHVRLWAHEKEVCDTIAHRRENEKFLAGQKIPAGVTACAELRGSARWCVHCRKRDAFTALPAVV